MLKVKQLSKVFNPNTINENRVFNNLSVEVNEGDFVSIIGSNGAGKSTLLNIISGTIEADSGSIMLNGTEVINKPEYVRAKSIGRVFQDPFKEERNVETGNKETKYKINFNKFQINFYKTLSKFKIYDTIEEEKKLRIFSNLYLPISVKKITNEEEEKVSKEYSIEEAVEKGTKQLEQQIESEIEEKNNILRKKCKCNKNRRKYK